MDKQEKIKKLVTIIRWHEFLQTEENENLRCYLKNGIARLKEGVKKEFDYCDFGIPEEDTPEARDRDAKKEEPNPLMQIEYLIEEAHKTAVDKGWWSKPRSFGEIIALMHSELSEALEAYRENGLGDNYVDSKPHGITEEFADVLIRIFDFCGKYQLPLGKILLEKMEYNKNRPYRHGGKKI